MKVSLGLNNVAAGVVVKNLPLQNESAQKKSSNVQSDVINLNHSPNNVAFGAWGNKTSRENVALRYETWLMSRVFNEAASSSKEDISRFIDNNFEKLLEGGEKHYWNAPAPDDVYLALWHMNEHGGKAGKNIYNAVVEKLEAYDFDGKMYVPEGFDFRSNDGFPLSELIALMSNTKGCKSYDHISGSFVRSHSLGSGDAAFNDAMWKAYSQTN